MERNAPYASVTITLSLQSTTGLKYRTLNCVECGRPFMERSGDLLTRIGSVELPEMAHVGLDGAVAGLCGRCKQRYAVFISATANTARAGLPLNMQPQSIFIVSEPAKKFRDTYCLECGKAFFGISDRVNLIADSATPMNMINPLRVGPLEARCKFHYCKQRWYIRA